jgi:hypothetical protein
MSAIKNWRLKVESHHAQSLKTQAESGWRSEDAWADMAFAWKADPHRTDDPILNALSGKIRASQSVLDVGGGAGRYALPLAAAVIETAANAKPMAQRPLKLTILNVFTPRSLLPAGRLDLLCRRIPFISTDSGS